VLLHSRSRFLYSQVKNSGENNNDTRRTMTTKRKNIPAEIRLRVIYPLTIGGGWLPEAYNICVCMCIIHVFNKRETGRIKRKKS